MARTRYRFAEPDRPPFLTCTVVEWLPVLVTPLRGVTSDLLISGILM
jgi:hypothetical protein